MKKGKKAVKHFSRVILALLLAVSMIPLPAAASASSDNATGLITIRLFMQMCRCGCDSCGRHLLYVEHDDASVTRRPDYEIKGSGELGNRKLCV